MLYKTVTSLKQGQKQAFFLTLDMLIVVLSYGFSMVLFLGPSALSSNLSAASNDLFAMMCIAAALATYFGLHKVKLKSYEMQGMLSSGWVALAITASGLAFSALDPDVTPPATVYIVCGMMFLILSVTSRLALRIALLRIYRNGNRRLRVLIYGAGQTGQQLATALATDDAVLPMAFVDDEPRLQSLTIAGLKVHKSEDLPELVKRYDIQRVILAMPSAPPAKRTLLTRRIAEHGVEVHALPSFADLISNDAHSLYQSRPVDLNELLGRDGLADKLPGSRDSYKGRCILVTGAGGSIGSELCRQLIAYEPAHLILLDHAEHALFEIERELRSLAPLMRISPVLGSVCEKSLVNVLMQSRKVEIVLHAAAYKHVPMVESNAIEGMRNNVIGTRTVAQAARDAGVERFILVSTDKAVRPVSVMGASKRFAEMIVQDLATRTSTTRFSMVRFGNVLGSSGSVIPLFAEQIARGGPVTLTHADVTRYFMTIPEAARLVLLAGSFARGGDVFVLDMGKPIAVRDVARKMIEGSGLTVCDADNPDGDIEIEITGLRPGEKLYEELLIGSDMLTTPHPKILRAQEGHLSEIELAKALKSLSEAIETRDVALLRSVLAQWIEQIEDRPDATVNQ
ncbi:Nucleotide sugar epimerase/dehydratase [Roseovarius sp. EC-HK134]|uniref:polysaccharide biosynthesis protein n=1 Tax=Roseovarius sp. EC-HK134 TaxID=2038394 RepID=UPI00125BD83F|nr:MULTISPECIES: nucleoside-diphosphate sugar epimerase/dehydratase [Roseovarius]MBW4972541.1 polysaccharide biosynthesis protein [Roseovarius mucosus]VVT25892.1 Nucleotide sugar epimerase/dehydratase [Roseovarius sp. EC-HK134]VVT26058.1 Nucleotide sugar epimerase/dehydratase [Roseovarius sp. EC-SD190]